MKLERLEPTGYYVLLAWERPQICRYIVYVVQVSDSNAHSVHMCTVYLYFCHFLLVRLAYQLVSD